MEKVYPQFSDFVYKMKYSRNAALALIIAYRRGGRISVKNISN
jgi:hypothetical protein